MPFISTDEFRQAIRDGASMGISKQQIYMILKQKGYEIEGEPKAKPSVEESGGLLGYLGTTVKSALREIGSVAKFAGHYATNPGDIIPDALETGKNVAKVSGQVVIGGVQNLYEGVTGQEFPSYNPGDPIWEPTGSRIGPTEEQRVSSAVTRAVKEAVTNPLETFRDHPLSTLSVVAPVGAGALNKVSSLSKIAGLTKTAEGLSTASKVVGSLDPVSAAIKAPAAITKVGSKVVKEGLGLMSGAGGEAADLASQTASFQSPFYQGMRGDSLQQGRILAQDAQKALDILKSQRRAKYLQTNEAMRAITEPMKPTTIQSLLQKTMKEFRIASTEKGILDQMVGFTDDEAVAFLHKMMKAPDAGTNLPPLVQAGLGEGAGANKIAKAIQYVERWSDYTPDGLDRLQKSLSLLDAKAGTPEYAFINTLKKGVQKTVSEKYPEYTKMMTDYHEASDFIEELSGAIGNLDRKSIESTVRKLSQSMKTGNQGFQIRNKILEEMEHITGLKLRERIAGMAMNQVMPRGLAGVGAGIGGTAVVSGLLSPTFIFGLALSSPRVIGEVLGAIGVAKKWIPTTIRKLQQMLPDELWRSGVTGVDNLDDVPLSQIDSTEAARVQALTPEQIKAEANPGGTIAPTKAMASGNKAVKQALSEDVAPLADIARKASTAEDFVASLKKANISQVSPELIDAFKKVVGVPKSSYAELTSILEDFWWKANGKVRPPPPPPWTGKGINPADLPF